MFVQQVDGIDLLFVGVVIGIGDQVGMQVVDLFGVEFGIGDGIVYGQVGEGCCVVYEVFLFVVDQGVQVEVDVVVDLVVQVCFGVVGQGGDV